MELTYKQKPSGFVGEKQIKVISWWEKGFCCSEMKDAWGLTLIGLDDSGLIADRGPVNLHWKEVHEDDVDHEYYPIKYCPFCGNEIVYM